MKFKDLFKYLEFSDSTRVYNIRVKAKEEDSKPFTTEWKEIKLNWCCGGDYVLKYRDILKSSNLDTLYVISIKFDSDDVIITLSDVPE